MTELLRANGLQPEEEFEIHEIPAGFARGAQGAALAVGLASKYLGLAEPQLHFFNLAGDGDKVLGKSRPGATPAEIWVRCDLDYARAYRTALHEMAHIALFAFEEKFSSEAKEEEWCDWFADNFDTEWRKEHPYR